MFQPVIGRWLSRDPIGLDDGPNLYRYVLNNPVNEIDPSGLSLPPPATVPQLTPRIPRYERLLRIELTLPEFEGIPFPQALRFDPTFVGPQSPRRLDLGPSRHRDCEDCLRYIEPSTITYTVPRTTRRCTFRLFCRGDAGIDRPNRPLSQEGQRACGNMAAQTPGWTSPRPGTDNLEFDICIDCRLSSLSYSATNFYIVIQHELRHAQRWCRNPRLIIPGIPDPDRRLPRRLARDCSRCRTEERQAHETSCRAAIALGATSLSQRDCERCGIYLSCRGHCRNSTMPPNCDLEALGIRY